MGAVMRVIGRPAHVQYVRLGGVGIARTLWECQRCYAATADRARHSEWHEKQDGAGK